MYPNAQSLPGGGADPCVAVSVHTYGPPDFCLPTGSNDYYADAAAVAKGVDKRVAILRKWISSSGGIQLHIGEFGVGRESQDQRKDPRVKEHYRSVAQKMMREGWPATAWDDNGWFALLSKQGAWVHGLADAVIGGAAEDP